MSAPGKSCRCRNCVSEGAYADATGTIPANCLYRDHKRCVGCDYYGPITHPDQLCTSCAGRLAADEETPKGAPQ
ncbi:hypothetical protein JK358_38240 [Nocardia sp. 2]|uniref:Uncharacterized protein n=1 Tax=Nocardia acididurans TaxID=2802282 RepID=A0ABS1MI04_9NOCA|nr:hypothetical protein [Nocardia acididurans]MBL1080252.1 hypothetical protein [Nocardia acididurans]